MKANWLLSLFPFRYWMSIPRSFALIRHRRRYCCAILRNYHSTVKYQSSRLISHWYITNAITLTIIFFPLYCSTSSEHNIHDSDATHTPIHKEVFFSYFVFLNSHRAMVFVDHLFRTFLFHFYPLSFARIFFKLVLRHLSLSQPHNNANLFFSTTDLFQCWEAKFFSF